MLKAYCTIVPVRHYTFCSRIKISCIRYQLRLYSGQQYYRQASSAKKTGSFNWTWPLGLGFSCVAVHLLIKAVQRARGQRSQNDGELETWQLALFRQLPARLLSRTWGKMTAKELPKWCRRPVLGLYVWAFGCNMEEALIEDIGEYPSLSKLFTRQLKEDARVISSESSVISPCDGKVLYVGVVEPDGYIEQVKGVTYRLDKFLGSSSPTDSTVAKMHRESTQLQKCLYHIIIYLAPGDYHHFHSPADWTVHTRRHFPGELLTVAPWAARKMPGLFTLNERTVLLGNWIHGFFSFTAIGAFNVGSIALSLEEDFKTNIKGQYKMGEFNEKQLGDFVNGSGITVSKGERLGCFNLGSSIVLVFQAPKDFQFQVKPGNKVYFGQSL